MLLRSSSTPLFGSFHSSFPENPIQCGSPSPLHDVVYSSLHCSINMLPSYFHHPSGCVNLAAVSGNSSPISCNSAIGFRRVQSDGNLNGLAATCNSLAEIQQPKPNIPKAPLRKTRSLALETIPSFSYSLDNEEDDNKEEELGEEFPGLTSTIVTEHLTVEETAWSAGNREKLFQELYATEDVGVGGGVSSGGRNGGKGGGGDGSDNFRSRFPGGDGDEINQTEENYKRMLKDDPSNPLILRNYAEFLHKSKRDLGKAEEFCSRAILADPTDGEILSLYAQLSWNLHRDEEKATDYFNRAAQASPNNSYVHAAYARFLWEVEEDEKDYQTLGGINSSSRFRLASTNA